MCSRIFQAAGIAALAIYGLGATAGADPIDLQITSNGAWRSSDTFVSGWETTGFDDSAWANARAPYPSPAVPADLIPGTTAQFIWHDPAETSNGATGPPQVYVRFSFDLDLIGANAALTANANISVDDDYDLYVNGELVFQNNDGGFAHIVDTVDIAPFLQHGANVIAIYAIDTGGFERVLFDASVATLPRINIPIFSGDDWLTSGTFEAGWETIGFDDALWSAARAPYPGASAKTLMPDTNALPIWHDPTAVSDGTTGSIHAYFRYSFELSGTALPVVGQARINVDDDYDLYVNGILVHENHDDGNAHLVQFVDFSYALRAGPNVVAIHAVDGGWSNPRDRGNERLAFDGLVASGVLDWQFVPIVEGDLVYGPCGSNPVLNGDLLAFTVRCGLIWHFPQAGNTMGVYKLDLAAGTSELVAGEDTPAPGNPGSYLTWWYQAAETGAPSIDNGEVAFPAAIYSDSSGEIVGHGIFLKGDGPIETLVDTDTSIPGGTGTFRSLNSPTLSQGQIAFSGDGLDSQSGTYIADSTGVTVVADRSTSIPTGGTFTGFGIWPSIDRGNVAFRGGGSGIYLYDGVSATIGVVADTLTAIPGGDGALFSTFSCSPDYADGMVSFSNDGVHTWSAGSLHNLSAAGGCHPPTSGGCTAFDHAYKVFTDIGLGVNEVVGGDNPLSDVFDDPHEILQLELFHEGIARNRIAFNAEVVGETSGNHEIMIVADDAFTFAGDADGDGIADNADNCTLNANGAQSDTDGDGYGNACDPDLTNDGAVNFADLAEMDDVFFSADPDADLNQDGVVNFADLAIAKLFFFGPPGPSALVQ